MNVILTEDIETTGSTWGVSRTSHNPEPRDHIACASMEDAVRLVDWLQNMECVTCRQTKHVNEFANPDQCNECAKPNPEISPRAGTEK